MFLGSSCVCFIDIDNKPRMPSLRSQLFRCMIISFSLYLFFIFARRNNPVDCDLTAPQSKCEVGVCAIRLAMIIRAVIV